MGRNSYTHMISGRTVVENFLAKLVYVPPNSAGPRTGTVHCASDGGVWKLKHERGPEGLALGTYMV